MDVLTLSRMQFAATTFFHFLFVPLTLGLGILIAVMETLYVRRGDEEYKRMAQFWGRIFIANFAIGVVTGITLEFQFGTNWARYSEYVGDIFGSLLAIEATVAFFLESTFLAVWIFGWQKVSKRVHLAAIWLVAIASNLSAYWIIVANAWMQHPVGYEIRNGRAELTDFIAVVTQPSALVQFLHTIGGAFILSGFFVMGVSAWHLLRRPNVSFFTRSFRLAVGWTLVFSVLEVVQGHINGQMVAKNQPAKLAAFEAQWKTRTHAPQNIVLLPDEANEQNRLEIGHIPNLLSVLAYGAPEAEVTGLLAFPRELRPPVNLSFHAFRLMVALGMLFPIIAFVAWWWRNQLDRHPWFLKLLVWVIPLPYIANLAGWTVAEVGRQPWIVYGLMKTSDGVSQIPAGQVGVTLVGFVLLYGVLGATNFWLVGKFAGKGPE
jgi:cytochrome d ubiquinol oxidase subunit I